MITSKELQKIKKIKGEIRGTSFKDDFNYVREKEGEKQIGEVKKRLQELGCQEAIYREKVKIFSWYPLWCHILFLDILYKEMGWTQKDIFNIGFHATRTSLALKVLPKGAFNLKKILSKADKYWKNDFGTGRVEVKEYNPEKNYVILNLKEFNVHPLECWTIKGYLAGLVEILGVSKGENIKVKETKCVHRGNKFHQFQVTWK